MSNTKILDELVKKYKSGDKNSSKSDILSIIRNVIYSINYDCANIEQKKNMLISDIVRRTDGLDYYDDAEEKYRNIIFDTCAKIGGIQAFDIIYSIEKDEKYAYLKNNPNLSIVNGDLSKITVYKDTPNAIILDKITDYLLDPNSLTHNNKITSRRSTPTKELILVKHK